jgi:hypothetical protein
MGLIGEAEKYYKLWKLIENCKDVYRKFFGFYLAQNSGETGNGSM